MGAFYRKKKQKKITYKDDKWDGPWVSYYENGQLLIKETHKNGNLTSKETYKNGVKVK